MSFLQNRSSNKEYKGGKNPKSLNTIILCFQLIKCVIIKSILNYILNTQLSRAYRRIVIAQRQL